MPIGFLRPGTSCAREDKGKGHFQGTSRELCQQDRGGGFQLAEDKEVSCRGRCSWPELRGVYTHQPIFFFPCLHADLLDVSQMVLRIEGPQRLPRGYEIVLYIPASDADKVGVFYAQSKFFLTPSSSFVVLLRSLQLSSLTLSSPHSSDDTSEATHALSILLQIFLVLIILSS